MRRNFHEFASSDINNSKSLADKVGGTFLKIGRGVTKYGTAIAVGIGTLGYSNYAEAQTMCGNRTDVLGKLSNGYSENATAMGLSSNGGVVEVLTSPKGNTWTIIITMPNGVSCLIAAGESWETLPLVITNEKKIKYKQK